MTCIKTLWCVHVCCLHLKMEFRSCARGRQWCGIIHYYWWTASIKPRLLFSRAGYASLSSVYYVKYSENSTSYYLLNVSYPVITGTVSNLQTGICLFTLCRWLEYIMPWNNVCSYCILVIMHNVAKLFYSVCFLCFVTRFLVTRRFISS